MKKKTLGFLFAVIASGSLNVMANSDNSQYPAANFQPTVIFADESAQSTGSSSVFDPEFPAASFQPKVLFFDASANKSQGETSAFDANFPAANFQPTVVYP